MRDLYSELVASRGLSPAAATTNNTDHVSEIAQTYGLGALILLETGALSDADAVFSIKVEEGDNSALSDAATVSTAQLRYNSTQLDATPESGFQFAYDFGNDNEQIKIGYLGNKKYLRVTISPANNTGNSFVTVSILSVAPKQS